MMIELLPDTPVNAASEHCALFLDLDGTLLEIAERPESVDVDEGIKALIARLLAAHGGAVALITGRSIAGVDMLLSPLRLPVAGQHGLERRDSRGRVHEHRASLHLLDEARTDIASWAALRPGVHVEDKGLSIAVHYRQALSRGDEVEAFLRGWIAAHGIGLQLQAGKKVIELKPSGRDKGLAIGDFLQEAPFKDRYPIFVGDDLTDEYGFAFVNEHSGMSVKVGPGATVARYRLADVTAVRRWLEQLAASGKERR